MVIQRIVRLVGCVAVPVLMVLFLGADQADGGSTKLDPASHVKMWMALLGILIIGMALMVLVVMGAHRVRRLARSRLGASHMQEDAWYEKPLVESLDEESAHDNRREDDPDSNGLSETDN